MKHILRKLQSVKFLGSNCFTRQNYSSLKIIFADGFHYSAKRHGQQNRTAKGFLPCLFSVLLCFAVPIFLTCRAKSQITKKTVSRRFWENTYIYLYSKMPKPIPDVQATWKCSNSNDLILWLQFMTTLSTESDCDANAMTISQQSINEVHSLRH